MMDRAARVDALLDRQEIYACLSRMSRATDRADRELFLSAFHADSVIAVGPFVGSAEELFDWSTPLQAIAHKMTHHVLGTHNCELAGDTAHTETYYLYIAVNHDGTNLIAGGRYIDRFERRNGEWRLQQRNNAIEWSSVVPGIENPLNNVADILANGIAARSKEDISYRRPYENRREKFMPPGMGG